MHHPARVADLVAWPCRGRPSGAGNIICERVAPRGVGDGIPSSNNSMEFLAVYQIS